MVHCVFRIFWQVFQEVIQCRAYTLTLCLKDYHTSRHGWRIDYLRNLLFYLDFRRKLLNWSYLLNNWFDIIISTLIYILGIIYFIRLIRLIKFIYLFCFIRLLYLICLLFLFYLFNLIYLICLFYLFYLFYLFCLFYLVCCYNYNWKWLFLLYFTFFFLFFLTFLSLFLFNVSYRWLLFNFTVLLIYYDCLLFDLVGWLFNFCMSFFDKFRFLFS